MDNLKTKLITFCKAQCSAWIASAIDFGTTIIFAHVFGLWYGYSTFIGALSGGIANCLINYRWVFHAYDVKKKSIAIRYLLVWSGSILLNTYGTYILTELSDHMAIESGARKLGISGKEMHDRLLKQEIGRAHV